MFPGQCGNTAFFFKSQPDQFHFEFRGIVFPGKSFFSAHEVSTCKISGCLSYRILDSGPDGTQTTLTLESYFEVYRDNLMAILRKPASRKNHTNVLMHIQGYFSNYLSTRQRKELSEVILNYRFGTLPLLAPLTLLKHYLGEYPNDYLLTQNYFDPYPEELALRLMVN